MRLLLGIPTAGSPAEPFLRTLAGLCLPAQSTAFEKHIVTGNFVPAQRELLVERAIEHRADVLLCIDDDMIVPPDAIVRLCDVLDAQPRAAIAGALYYSRDGFRPMAVDDWDPRDTTLATIPPFDDRTPVRVAGVGFGCVALRVAALTHLEPPFFAAHVFLERAAARVRISDEDYLLCARLRSAQWQVWLHPGVRCGHFDRATSTVAPAVWESPERTSRRRAAVLRDGVPTLVDASEQAPSIPETHRKIDLEYVSND